MIILLKKNYNDVYDDDDSGLSRNIDILILPG